MEMKKRHSLVNSFSYAFQGIRTAFKNEPHLRIHTFFAILALVVGIILGLSFIEWLLLAFTIFYVITLELLNTVLENVVNLVSPEVNPYAKVAKDVSAACVLLAAGLSIIVGVALFLPKIILLLQK
jgi:undecaprenol kinase